MSTAIHCLDEHTAGQARRERGSESARPETGAATICGKVLSAVPNRDIADGHTVWPLCVPTPLTCDNLLNALSNDM